MTPVAVVTGAANGIGRAIALRLCRDGYEVVAVDRDGDALTRAFGGTSIRALPADVTTEVERLAGLRCSLLVNNAGIWRFSSLAKISLDDARAVLETNLVAPLALMRLLVPTMTGGAVVNVSSVVSRFPPRGLGLYPPSKSALETLTRMAAVEFGPLGVRCNAVAPGLVPTEGTGDFYGPGMAALLPLGRLGTPEDIADVVAFLGSDASRYVTGQVIAVDGGYLAAGAGFFAAAAN